MKRLYRLTAGFAVLGAICEWVAAGPRDAVGFLLGALGSIANLWTFDFLSGAIAPGERKIKPWPASLFVGRYIILVAAGYATVKTLDVRPLAVLLGLLVSTAAALTSAILDLIQGLFERRSQ